MSDEKKSKLSQINLSKEILLIITILAVTIILSIITYQYSNTSASQILELSENEIRAEAKIQSHHIANEFATKVGVITSNLEIISHSKTILNKDVPDSVPLFNSAQKSTADLTGVYAWIGKDGKLLWTTAGMKNIGTDVSNGDYYSKPKQTLMPYYSNTIEVKNGTLALTISYPIFTNDSDKANSFNGVIVAGVPISKLGQFAKDNLAPGYENSLGLMDKGGILLYSSNSTTSNTKFIGKNIFGKEIQSVIPSDIKDQFNTFVRNSLNGQTGYVDFSYMGKTTTIAYDPIKIGNDSFGVIYVSAPHDFTLNAVALAEQPRLVNLISIVIVGLITVLIAVILFTWNNRLKKLVEDRTRDLKLTNDSLKEANDHLIALEKMEREFINIAAHELKTPVQSVVLMSEEIEENLKKESEKINLSRDYAEIIVRNTKRISGLINSLLMVSKLEHRKFQLNEEKINLQEKILKVIEEIRPLVGKEQDVKIVFNPQSTGNILVNADKNMLYEVISNLLVNAIKFTKHGIIEINVSSKDGYALVAIRDTGVGISPEIAGTLFGKFISTQGTGLGLFISKNIIEMHGGKIWAENNSDGKGATFFFTLQLV